jgi:hypothetical protein
LLLKKQSVAPKLLVTDKLRSYAGVCDWPAGMSKGFGPDGSASYEVGSWSRAARTLACSALKFEFATDSPLEGGGFEPSVPRWGQHFFETTAETGD